ncbi:hypothetical protein BS47DRAFT_325437 [Hydnum rufescens UP504]|uniref:Uncharacterized protein n=1 Tax=Hydnum rufescens UP504 TaxID=1448309 RepID=A0A9P6B6H5_9AGAM|nr:hypothetical protein BS47DRAFT_325437 [Hydnum rufescens UP504]
MMDVPMQSPPGTLPPRFHEFSGASLGKRPRSPSSPSALDRPQKRIFSLAEERTPFTEAPDDLGVQRLRLENSSNTSSRSHSPSSFYGDTGQTSHGTSASGQVSPLVHDSDDGETMLLDDTSSSGSVDPYPSSRSHSSYSITLYNGPTPPTPRPFFRHHSSPQTTAITTSTYSARSLTPLSTVHSVHINVTPATPATPDTPTKRHRMMMGPRTGCEKCRLKVPGHWMHVD